MMMQAAGSSSQEETRPEEVNNDSDIDSEELEDYHDWDRFDVSVEEFSNIRKSNGFPLHNYKIFAKHDNKESKYSLAAFQRQSKEICDKLISLTAEERHEVYELPKQLAFKKYRGNFPLETFQLDQHSEFVLCYLLKKKLLKQINGLMRVGKEGAIYHADTYGSYKGHPIPKECVVKVFKANLNIFNEREYYLLYDYRVKKHVHTQKTTKVINLFADKEKMNLVKLKEIGIPCPEFIMKKTRVVVMSFIGENYEAAEKLKFASLAEEDCVNAYRQVVDYMRKMYKEVHLIHGDLSEYNILWHNKTCYFLDLSQAVEPCHVDVFHFLMDDCHNVINFFKDCGVTEIVNARYLFKSIVGCDYGDRLELESIARSFMETHYPLGRL